MAAPPITGEADRRSQMVGCASFGCVHRSETAQRRQQEFSGRTGGPGQNAPGRGAPPLSSRPYGRLPSEVPPPACGETHPVHLESAGALQNSLY